MDIGKKEGILLLVKKKHLILIEKKMNMRKSLIPFYYYYRNYIINISFYLKELTIEYLYKHKMKNIDLIFSLVKKLEKLFSMNNLIIK